MIYIERNLNWQDIAEAILEARIVIRNQYLYVQNKQIECSIKLLSKTEANFDTLSLNLSKHMILLIDRFSLGSFSWEVFYNQLPVL